MEQYFKSFILSFLLLFSVVSIQAQTGCDLLRELGEDMAEAGTTLRPFFEDAANVGGKRIKAYEFVLNSPILRKIPANLNKVDILKTLTFNDVKFIDYLKSTFEGLSTETKKIGFFNAHFNPQDVGGKKLFGDFVGDEVNHTVDIMNQKGYTSAFFEKDAPGIEGFLFKNGSNPSAVSLKNLQNSNFNTIIEEIDDVVNKINANINRYKGTLVKGSNSNTIFELKIGQYAKSEFMNLLEANPTKFLNNNKTKYMFEEVKFIFNDGSTLRYDVSLNLL